MKITMPLKMSLFAFLSAVVCAIGNQIIYLVPLLYITQALWFLAYLFLMIWICQLFYGKFRYSVNLTFLIMSLALAIYAGAMFYIDAEGFLAEYYVMALYFFAVVCIASTILLIGKLIFSSPKSKEPRLEAAVYHTEDVAAWTCSCGAVNTGKFCAECGAPAVATSEVTE